jgi:hypothetical protein
MKKKSRDSEPIVEKSEQDQNVVDDGEPADSRLRRRDPKAEIQTPMLTSLT